MEKRPLIGVPAQTMERQAEAPGNWRIGRRYVTALSMLGAIPLVIPLLDDQAALRGLYDRLEGILLCGGGDPDPACYGQETQPYCGRIEWERDPVELRLVRWAREEQKPVLGICRGIQIINVAYGGTLYQDIANQKPGAIKHDYFPSRDGSSRDRLVHPVGIDRSSRIGRSLGVDNVEVNSMHHQAIDRLGGGLRATAWAPDGLVEAVEANGDHYLVAVQWHPEELMDNDAGTRRLFADFIDASAGYLAG